MKYEEWGPDKIKKGDTYTLYIMNEIQDFEITDVSDKGFSYKAFFLDAVQSFENREHVGYVKKNGAVYMAKWLKDFLELMEM